MKVCPKCKQQCEDGDNACPNCGFDFESMQSQSNINMGNANAVSGGVHSTDDHSVHDSNNQSNSNNASNSYNTTNNTTINQAPKTDAEKLKESIDAYRLKCKELFEDGLLSSDGERLLREFQVALNLVDEIALPIKEEIRVQSKKRKKHITQVGMIDIRQTKSIIEQNTAPALQRQLTKLEAWMKEYDDDSLSFVYYQMSAMLEPVRYTNRYEDSAKDEYWETFWAYVAYLLQNREMQANEALASLGRWHAYFPEQNDVVMQLTGKMMLNDTIEDIAQIRNSLSSQYTADLQLLLDAIDELLQKDWTKEYISIRPAHTFYVNTLFANFAETQKTLGLQRLNEQRELAKQKREEDEKRRHEEELAQQAAEKAKADAEAEAARLAAEQQNAENLAKAQELARKQQEAQEAAAAAAKAEADRIEQERLAAIEEEKRRRRDAIVAWFERNIWYIIGGLIVIGIIVFLCIYVPAYRQKKEDEQKQIELYQEKQGNYETLSRRFCEQVSSITFEKALNAVDAYNTLCEMRDIEMQYTDVKTDNNITFSSGKSLLLLKSDSILCVLRSAENDVFCSPEDKIIIKKKIIELEQIKSKLQ